jgi:hypothetical protein
LTCQYPVEVSTLPETQKFLVIDAAVTEDFAKVNVFYSLENITSTGAYTLPKVPVATAFIKDSRGVQYQVANTRGLPDSAFKGRIGETYQLTVDVDGKFYESDKQTMRACPDVDSLVVRYHRESFRSSGDLLYDGFDVYAESKDAAGIENFYQWDWTHYERATWCIKRFSATDGQEVLFPCFPTDCWNISRNERVIIQNDKLRDGSAINQFVVRVPYATPPNNYYLRIEQRSISQSVYDYLKSLETQTESVGTLFDLPAQTRFNPNVYNITDRDEKLMGVFSVYSARHKIVYVDMFQTIPGAKPKVIIEPTPFTSDTRMSSPCTEEINRTQIKPEGWIN